MGQLRLRRIKNLPRISQLVGSDGGGIHPRQIYPKAYAFSTRTEGLLQSYDCLCDVEKGRPPGCHRKEERASGEGPASPPPRTPKGYAGGVGFPFGSLEELRWGKKTRHVSWKRTFCSVESKA